MFFSKLCFIQSHVFSPIIYLSRLFISWFQCTQRVRFVAYISFILARWICTYILRKKPIWLLAEWMQPSWAKAKYAIIVAGAYAQNELSLAILDGWMQRILCGPTHAVCIHSANNQTNFFLRLRIHLARMKEMPATKHILSLYKKCKKRWHRVVRVC